MELKPVSDYHEAEYPSLTEYFSDDKDGHTSNTLMLVAATAALALLLSGCASFS